MTAWTLIIFIYAAKIETKTETYPSFQACMGAGQTLEKTDLRFVCVKEEK